MILTPIDESKFQNWYLNLPVNKQIQKEGYEIPSADDPEHFYDYRKAFMSGSQAGLSGHLPSEFKKMGHPRGVLGGVYTMDDSIYGAENNADSLTGRFGMRKGLGSVFDKGE